MRRQPLTLRIREDAKLPNKEFHDPSFKCFQCSAPTTRFQYTTATSAAMSAKSLNKLGRICQHQRPPLRVGSTPISLPVRSLATTSSRYADIAPNPPSPADPPPPPSSNNDQALTAKENALRVDADPDTADNRRLERVLMRQGRPPVGSRRRRAAVKSGSNIPFEQLPYQCFQEARKVLLEDRQTKLDEIAKLRGRIERLKLQDVGRSRSALVLKERRLLSMLERLEKTKVLADINDPLVKKRFEDGEGDMSKPVYRHLALQKFKSRRYLILKQRLSQMHVYPDVLPPFEISYDVQLSFGRKNVEPGDFVPSVMSERPPKLTVQPFDRGERLVTVAVVDPDVPDVEADAYSKRCHFLAVNVPIGPTNTRISISDLMGSLEMKKTASGEGYEGKDAEETSVTQEKRKGGDVLLSWLPPYAQKGSPYHRLAVVVLQQYRPLNANALRREGKYGGTREDVSVVAMMSRFHVRPMGGFVFRTQWDSGMDGLMGRLGVEEVGEELKRKKVEPLPYKWRKSMNERYR